MATPTTYAVTIKINDVDVSSYVPLDSMSLDDNARDVSYFRFTCENPSGVTPTKNHTVVVTADDLTGTPTVFDGYIIEINTRKRDNGITVEYQIEAADKKMRLKKSVLDTDYLTGTDADILSNLLGNAYPDLSSLFDFSSGVTGFTGDLTLPVGNKSVLDALNDLSTLTGGDFSFDNTTSNSGLITFGDSTDVIIRDTVGFTEPEPNYYNALSGTNFSPVASIVSTGGNPGYCIECNPTSGSSAVALATLISLNVLLDQSSNYTLNGFTFDYYITGADASDVEIYLQIFDDVSGIDSHTLTTPTTGSWTTLDASTYLTFPVEQRANIPVQIYLRVQPSWDFSTDDITVRLDNVNFDVDPVFPGGGDIVSLDWGAEPPASDFDFDIQSGDEFGFDFDLTIGDIDDINSITVIGGYEDYSIDWTYHNNNYEERINLEAPVSDIVVYTNSGTDVSPTWGTALDVGVWGTDKLTSEGGTKDALYDETNAWLIFDTIPPDLEKSVRVTGTIKRPVRVRVDDVATGDPTYATVYRDENITSQDDAVAIAESKLAQRNALRRMTFKTYEPGLKPGQSINIADSARGLNETLTITRIQTKWLGDYAEFSVDCGEDDYPSADILIANNDRRSRQNALPPVTQTTSITYLTDDSDNALTDDNGRRLYHG